ncbi:MAG: valine--tRNA ligase, partial [Clostridia bacterium]|nr:valine--tRNA ligase [Clostridia bacterium]
AGQVSIAAQPPENTDGMVTAVTHEARMFIPLSELVDVEKEKARIWKELTKSEAELNSLNAKLSNPGFTGKAPAHIVSAERERAERLAALAEKLTEQLNSM